MTPTDVAGNGTYADLQWVSSHQALWFLYGLVVVLVVVAVVAGAPWLMEAADRGARWAARVAGLTARAVVARFARTGRGGAHWRHHTSAGLAILGPAVRPGDDPREGGEEDAPGEAVPDPADEPYDPLTSEILADPATPLHDALVQPTRPDWDLDFTGSWRVIDTSKVADPGPTYTARTTGQPQPAETAGAR